MGAQSTSGLSVELLSRVIDVKYGYFTLLYPMYFYSLADPSQHTQFRQQPVRKDLTCEDRLE